MHKEREFLFKNVSQELGFFMSYGLGMGYRAADDDDAKEMSRRRRGIKIIIIKKR